MIHRTLCFALLAALAAPTALAYQRPAAAPAPAAPKPIAPDLSAEFPRLFPDRTGVYVEVPHLGTVVAAMGPEQLLELANTVLAAPKPPEGEKGTAEKPAPALSSRDFSTLLDASVAAGVIPARDDDSALSFEMFDPQRAVVVLRMSSADGVTLLRERVLGRLGEATLAKIAGFEIAHTASLSYIVSGRTVAVGPRASVEAIAETVGGDGRRLGDEPGYVSAVAKHAAGYDQVFVYTGGPVMARSMGMMFGVQPPRADGKPADQRAAMLENAIRTFVGLEAIQGLGLGVRVSGDSVKARYDFEIDRSKLGLVSILSDPPPLAMRSAAFLPADVEQVTGLSVDLTRIYDLAEQSFGPVPPAPGSKSFAQEVAEIEQNLGVSLRTELLPAIGTEFALTGTLDGLFGGRGGYREGMPRPLSVLIVEVRDADLAKRALVRALASAAPDAPQIPSVDYKGVELFQGPGVAVAFVPGFGIVGDVDDVRRCVDAHVSGQTLQKSGEFLSQSSGWAGDGLLATYESAAYRDAVEKADAKMRETTEGEAIDPTPYLFMRGVTSSIPRVIHRDGTGVHWEASVPSTLLAGVGEMLLKEALAAAQPKAPPPPESDSVVAGALRMLASAEAVFQSQNDRFATVEELVGASMLDADDLERVSRAGYSVLVTPDGTGDGATFQILATPVEYGKPGKLSFYIDHSYVIRAADKQGAPAGAGDPPLTYGYETTEVEPPPDLEGVPVVESVDPDELESIPTLEPAVAEEPE